MTTRKSPGRATGAIPNISDTTGKDAAAIVVQRPDIDAFLATAGAVAILTDTPGSRWRRRVYLTVAAAEKAAYRARQRGHKVRMVLVRLEPVYELPGLAQPPLCHDGPTTEAGPPGVGSTERALTHSLDCSKEGLA